MSVNHERKLEEIELKIAIRLKINLMMITVIIMIVVVIVIVVRLILKRLLLFLLLWIVTSKFSLPQCFWCGVARNDQREFEGFLACSDFHYWSIPVLHAYKWLF